MTDPTTPSAMEEAEKIVGEWYAAKRMYRTQMVKDIARALSERAQHLADENLLIRSAAAGLEARLRERERALALKDADLQAYVKDVDRRMGEREREVERLREALGRIVAELSDVQIQAVREGCGNTNAAVLHLRVHEAKKALGAAATLLINHHPAPTKEPI